MKTTRKTSVGKKEIGIRKVLGATALQVAGILLLAAIAAGLMTLLAISMQSIKAALSNPVEAIRSEA